MSAFHYQLLCLFKIAAVICFFIGKHKIYHLFIHRGKTLVSPVNNDKMGQSLVQNYIHLVWSTKHRQPFIQPPVEEELHNYLGGTCNELGCQVIKVGGYTDHVHVLCMLSKKLALMDLLEKMKASSSKWVKTNGEGYENFYWQDGYGAFSVNPREVETVIQYIANQHAHHSKYGFQDEYRAFLKKYKVKYDERYVWD